MGMIGESLIRDLTVAVIGVEQSVVGFQRELVQKQCSHVSHLPTLY
jgi:hypothetical protein